MRGLSETEGNGAAGKHCTLAGEWFPTGVQVHTSDTAVYVYQK